MPIQVSTDEDEDDPYCPNYNGTQYFPDLDKFYVKFLRTVDKKKQDTDLVPIYKPDPPEPPFDILPKLGDVGFMRRGMFWPMFNLFSADTPDTDRYGLPRRYEPMSLNGADVDRNPAFYSAGTILCSRNVNYEDISEPESSIKRLKFTVRKGIWGRECHGVAFVFLADVEKETLVKSRVNDLKARLKNSYEDWAKFIHSVDLSPEARSDPVVIYGAVRARRWVRAIFVGPGPYMVEIQEEEGVQVVSQCPRHSHAICRAEPSIATLLTYEFEHKDRSSSPVPQYDQSHHIMLQQIHKNT